MFQLERSPHFVAVIVNWNRPDDTVECIQSLLNQTGVSLKIIIVDNGSTDDSVTILREKFPTLDLFANPINLKFGRGYNLGIRQALKEDSDYIFIINNDAVLAPDGLAIMSSYMTPDVGILSPLIYYADPPNVIWSIGGKLNPCTLEIMDTAVNVVDHGNWPSLIEQDFVTGCGMLLSRRVLENVGLFDEGFDHYYEDLDLCRRIRQSGFHIYTIPQAKMWHKVAMSSGGNDSPQERYWMARSSIRYFIKHGHGWRLLVIIPYRLGSAIKTTLRLIREKRAEAVKPYWKGLRDGLRDNIHL